MTPALKADLLRRFEDQLSRPPSTDEVNAYIRAWKRDEALYREALREGIDRDDPTIRNVLISRMRERALLQSPIPEPTEAELQQYFDRHRDQFEKPTIYEHEYVVFPKSEPGAAQSRAKYEHKLQAGATPATLGLRSTGAMVDRSRIEQEFGAETAERICHLPIGQWQSLETPDRLLLVRMIRIESGLPDPAELRARLAAGWKSDIELKVLDSRTKAIADRYQFKEPSE